MYLCTLRTLMIHSHFIATPAYWPYRYRRARLDLPSFYMVGVSNPILDFPILTFSRVIFELTAAQSCTRASLECRRGHETSASGSTFGMRHNKRSSAWNARIELSNSPPWEPNSQIQTTHDGCSYKKYPKRRSIPHAPAISIRRMEKCPPRHRR